MPVTQKPILFGGYKVNPSLSVLRRVETAYFTEVYSLSDQRFLYLFKSLDPATVSSGIANLDFVKIEVEGATYLAKVVSSHSRDLLRKSFEALTSPRGLNGVAGMRDLKSLLLNDVIRPLLEPEKYQKFKLTIPNGILLFGPPGCGKTFIVKKLAEELGYAFFELSPSSVGTPYVHGAVGNIARLFNQARDAAPAIIFIDEIEGLIPKREDLGSHADIKKEEINEFLLQLNNAGADKILVVGATNRPQMIDSAVMRSGRMDKRIFVPPPDFEARADLFRMCIQGRPHSQTVNFEKLARNSENYTGSDIELIVTESARRAVRDNLPEIDQNMLMDAIGQVKPSLTAADVASYLSFLNLQRW